MKAEKKVDVGWRWRRSNETEANTRVAQAGGACRSQGCLLDSPIEEAPEWDNYQALLYARHVAMNLVHSGPSNSSSLKLAMPGRCRGGI